MHRARAGELPLMFPSKAEKTLEYLVVSICGT